MRAVEGAAAEDENEWIEWKSDLDFSVKETYFTLARHIIGMSNRRVDEAGRFVEGFGYLLVGVEPGNRCGIAPVDPADLRGGIAPYLGPLGPRWTARYDTIDGPQVLIIIVNPPQYGDPLHALYREFGNNKVGNYRLGEIFVRKLGSTERADPGDLDYLAERRIASPTRRARTPRSADSGGQARHRAKKPAKPSRGPEEATTIRAAPRVVKEAPSSQQPRIEVTAADVARILYQTGHSPWFLGELRAFADNLHMRGMRASSRLLKPPGLGDPLAGPAGLRVEAFLLSASFDELNKAIHLLDQRVRSESEHPESDPAPSPTAAKTTGTRSAVTSPGHPAGSSLGRARNPAAVSVARFISGRAHNRRRTDWPGYIAAFLFLAILAAAIVHLVVRSGPAYLIATVDQGYGGHVGTVAFSPGGRTLAVARDDGTTALFNVESDKQASILGDHFTEGSASITGVVAFTPNGQILASGLDTQDGVELWNTANQGQIATMTNNYSDNNSGSYSSLAFSPDGRLLAAATVNGTELYNVTKQQMVANLATSDDQNNSDGISVAFSPDGSTLAAATDSGVELWDVRTHKLTTYLLLQPKQAWMASSVAYSPDGTVLAAGSSDGTVWLWDMHNYQRLGALTNSGWLIAFSPNGHTLATSGDSGDIELWNVITRTRIMTLTSNGCTNSLAFSPNGKILAQASCTGGAVNLWNVSGG